jgi:hypothetical protein
MIPNLMGGAPRRPESEPAVAGLWWAKAALAALQSTAAIFTDIAAAILAETSSPPAP